MKKIILEKDSTRNLCWITIGSRTYKKPSCYSASRIEKIITSSAEVKVMNLNGYFAIQAQVESV